MASWQAAGSAAGGPKAAAGRASSKPAPRGSLPLAPPCRPRPAVHFTQPRLQESAGLIGKEVPHLYTLARDGALFAWTYHKDPAAHAAEAAAAAEAAGEGRKRRRVGGGGSSSSEGEEERDDSALASSIAGGGTADGDSRKWRRPRGTQGVGFEGQGEAELRQVARNRAANRARSRLRFEIFREQLDLEAWNEVRWVG